MRRRRWDCGSSCSGPATTYLIPRAVPAVAVGSQTRATSSPGRPPTLSRHKQLKHTPVFELATPLPDKSEANRDFHNSYVLAEIIEIERQEAHLRPQVAALGQTARAHEPDQRFFPPGVRSPLSTPLSPSHSPCRACPALQFCSSEASISC